METAPPKASELCCPLPPSLVIPSTRVSAVAVAVYTLLREDGARVLVQGPSGAGKTVLLSHILRVSIGWCLKQVVDRACWGREGGHESVTWARKIDEQHAKTAVRKGPLMTDIMGEMRW